VPEIIVFSSSLTGLCVFCLYRLYNLCGVWMGWPLYVFLFVLLVFDYLFCFCLYLSVLEEKRREGSSWSGKEIIAFMQSVFHIMEIQMEPSEELTFHDLFGRYLPYFFQILSAGTHLIACTHICVYLKAFCGILN